MKTKCLFLVLFILAPSARVRAVTLGDGGEHTIDTAISNVDVINDPTSGEPTTLNVVPGGDIVDLTMHGSSVLNVSGGIVEYISLDHTATATLSSGEFSFVNAFGDNKLSVTGGTISHVICQGTSTATIYSGDISNVSAQQFSVIDVHGGTYFTAFSQDSGVLWFYGGDVQRLGAESSGTTNIYGGNVLEELIVYPHSVLNIYGTALAISGGHVVGTLLNQDPIDAPILFYGGQINLHVVPEPTTAALLVIGCVVALVARRR